MALTLTIENETSLADGGPLSVTIRGKRGLDIGRDSHLDWTLPDPNRYISGKHCEIRFKDGGYWLHDVSTNGTFLNGDDHRMQAPHRLRSGDRFAIGHYIVAATVEEEEAAAAPQKPAMPAPPRIASDEELWVSQADVPPPIDAKQLKPAKVGSPVRSDFLDWAADIADPVRMPASARSPQRPAPSGADPDMAWAIGKPSPSPTPPPPAPAPPIPEPRHPSRDWQADNPWDEGAPVQQKPGPFAEPAAAMTTAEATSAPALAPAAAELGSVEAFLRQIAKAADLPEEVFQQKDAAEIARQLGAVMRIVAENLMQLLNARAQAKRLTRSANQTMVQAIDNNPLKFAPSAAEALRIMLGPPTQSYLDTERAVEESFKDLKRHQIKTFSAMQHALTKLMADVSPDAIEKDTEDDRGLTGLLTSRKAKLWDNYTAQWRAKVRSGDNGPIEAFMLYFADFYERDG